MTVARGGPCPPSFGLPPGYFDEEGQELLARVRGIGGARVLVGVAGAELFTGNNLIAMAWASRLIGFRELKAMPA